MLRGSNPGFWFCCNPDVLPSSQETQGQQPHSTLPGWTTGLRQSQESSFRKHSRGLSCHELHMAQRIFNFSTCQDSPKEKEKERSTRGVHGAPLHRHIDQCCIADTVLSAGRRGAARQPASPGLQGHQCIVQEDGGLSLSTEGSAGAAGIAKRTTKG